VKASPPRRQPGIKPGDKLELDLLPDGRGMLKAAGPSGSIEGFIGFLSGRTDKVATIEEMNAALLQATQKLRRRDNGNALIGDQVEKVARLVKPSSPAITGQREW